MSAPCCVVPTGTANLASVLAGLERAGASPFVAREPREVLETSLVVLPGVGAFAASMRSLEEREFVGPLRERFASDRPLLAICVGFQLLFDDSEESPGAEGLALVPGRVERFREGRVPQLGWNDVEPAAGARFVEPGAAYYANSYRVGAEGAGACATSEYGGGRFVAALERGPHLACQFHPELSGAWGRALLARWVEEGASC